MRRKVENLTEKFKVSEKVLVEIALAVEMRDVHMDGHCERLAQYAVKMGERMGLSEKEMTALFKAAFLHDLGMIAVQDSILLKRTRLDAEDMAIVRRHPLTGERLCHLVKSLYGVTPIIRHHHERFDGTGYPDGLEGKKIPLGARILTVLDIYDALTSFRSFRAAYSRVEALTIMTEEKEWGGQDPEIARLFIDGIDEGYFDDIDLEWRVEKGWRVQEE